MGILYIKKFHQDMILPGTCICHCFYLDILKDENWKIRSFFKIYNNQQRITLKRTLLWTVNFKIIVIKPLSLIYSFHSLQLFKLTLHFFKYIVSKLLMFTSYMYIYLLLYMCILFISAYVHLSISAYVQLFISAYMHLSISALSARSTTSSFFTLVQYSAILFCLFSLSSISLFNPSLFTYSLHFVQWMFLSCNNNFNHRLFFIYSCRYHFLFLIFWFLFDILHLSLFWHEKINFMYIIKFDFLTSLLLFLVNTATFEVFIFYGGFTGDL